MTDVQKNFQKKESIIFKILFFSSLILLVNACKTKSPDCRTAIGLNGNITEIIIPENTDPTVKFAATELQKYVAKITGTQLAIKESKLEDKNTKAIRFSSKTDTTIQWDGFRIMVDDNGIVIKSNTPRGFLYGTYQLLEDAGCSFVYLDKMEEIVPNRESIEFQLGERLFSPRLEHRGLVADGLDSTSMELGRDFIDWMAKNRFNYILVSVNRPSDSPGSEHGIVWRGVGQELLPELQKRDFVIEMSEHCTHEFFPRTLFNGHPDWFALVDGKRSKGTTPFSGQICYSNKDAVEYYANALADYAAKHPEFHTIGTWPLDGNQYCECEGCKDPQAVFNAATRVAEKIRNVNPDMVVEHLAYRPQTWQPPKMDKLPENMSVLWCPDPGDKGELLREWVSKSKDAGGVYLFEYYLGDNYRSMANLWLRPEYASYVVDYANNIGYRGVISLFLPLHNWWRTCLNNWFFAKACWDTQPDIETWLHGYCQKYYGNCALEAEKIFNTMFTELHPEPYKRIKDEDFIDRNELIKPVVDKILIQLNDVINHTEDSAVNERLLRLKTYIEYFSIYSQACSDRTKESLRKVAGYSINHPEHDMVLMSPEYILWRNSSYYK